MKHRVMLFPGMASVDRPPVDVDDGSVSLSDGSTVTADGLDENPAYNIRHDASRMHNSRTSPQGRSKEGVCDISRNKGIGLQLRKQRVAAKSFEAGGVNLSSVKGTAGLPTIVDIKSLCSLDAEFDESANNERLMKMKLWQRERKQKGAAIVVSSFLYTKLMRRQFLRVYSSILTIQSFLRRCKYFSLYSMLRQGAITVQRSVRGHWVRTHVAHMRILARRLSKLRVVYNLKVRRFRRCTKAATLIQTAYRRMRALYKLVELYSSWQECRDAVKSRESIIAAAKARKRVILNNFIRQRFIRSTLWISITVAVFSYLSFLFSFSGLGIASRLRQTDQSYLDASPALQLYYSETADGDLMPSILELYSRLAFSDIFVILGTVDTLFCKDAVHRVWCGESAQIPHESPIPSEVLSKFFLLFQAASICTVLLSLVSSLVLSSIIKKEVTEMDIYHINNWADIRLEKEERASNRIAVVSSAAVIFTSFIVMACSWISFFIALGIGLITSRYHFIWFVYPYIIDMCSENSLPMWGSVDRMILLPMQLVWNQTLSSDLSLILLRTYFVELAEIFLYGLILFSVSAGFVSFVSYSSRVNKMTQRAQRKLDNLTERIDAILEQL